MKQQTKKLFWLLLSLAIFCCAQTPGKLFCDEQTLTTFHLKSGKTVQGQITFESSVYYRVRTAEGREELVYRDDIVGSPLNQTTGTATATIQPGVTPALRDPIGQSYAKAKPLRRNEVSSPAVSGNRPEQDFKEWRVISGKIEELNRQSPGMGSLVLSASLVVAFGFLFMLPALVLKLLIKMVGARASFGKTLFFQIKTWLAFALLVVVFSLIGTPLIYVFAVFGPLSYVLFLCYVGLCVVASMAVYFKMMKGNFRLTNEQTIVCVVLLSIFYVIFSLAPKLIKYFS